MRRTADKQKIQYAKEYNPPVRSVADRLTCPASTLRIPSIPAGPGPEVQLMVEGAKELGQAIQSQMRTGEKLAQEAQKNRTLQIEAPRNAMEEYFVAMLSDLRRKEIQEVNNAYLTERQKEMLAEEHLRTKASMPGGLVAKVDENVALENELDEVAAREGAAAAEEEAAMTTQMGTTDPGDVATRVSAPTPADLDELRGELTTQLNGVADLYKQTIADSAGRTTALTKTQVDNAVSNFRRALDKYKGRGITPTEINTFAQRLRRSLSGKVRYYRKNPAAYLDAFRVEVPTQ